MAYKIVWTEEAANDIESVLDYLKENWPQAVAENFLLELYLKLDLIALHPNAGKVSKYSQIRKILVTKHNALYYLVSGSEITLLNIFDTRQDPKKDLYQ